MDRAVLLQPLFAELLHRNQLSRVFFCSFFRIRLKLDRFALESSARDVLLFEREHQPQLQTSLKLKRNVMPTPASTTRPFFMTAQDTAPVLRALGSAAQPGVPRSTSPRPSWRYQQSQEGRACYASISMETTPRTRGWGTSIFPNELWLAIVPHLGRRELAVLSRQYKALAHICLPYLYRAILNSLSPATSTGLLVHLASNPNVARCVKVFDASASANVSARQAYLLTQALAQMAKLEVLVLPENAEEGVLAGILPRLRMLKLHGIPTRACIKEHTNITALDVASCRLVDNIDIGPGTTLNFLRCNFASGAAVISSKNLRLADGALLQIYGRGVDISIFAEQVARFLVELHGLDTPPHFLDLDCFAVARLGILASAGPLPQNHSRNIRLRIETETTNIVEYLGYVFQILPAFPSARLIELRDFLGISECSSWFTPELCRKYRETCPELTMVVAPNSLALSYSVDTNSWVVASPPLFPVNPFHDVLET